METTEKEKNISIPKEQSENTPIPVTPGSTTPPKDSHGEDMVMWNGKWYTKKRAAYLSERRSKQLHATNKFKKSLVGKLIDTVGSVKQIKANRKKEIEISRLANTILQEQEIVTDESEQSGVTESAEELTNIVPPDELSIPTSITKNPIVEPVVKPIAPIRIGHGLTMRDAIVLRKSYEKSDILRMIFGGIDGDFFIINENTISKYSTYAKRMKKYNIVWVEDKNGFRYTIWFDITALSYLH